LIDAPILVVAAEAVPVPAAGPSAPPPPPPDIQSSAPASNTPKYMSDLPASWGSVNLEVTHARLAGLELLQGVGNLAKSAFADLFNHKDKDTKRTVTPKETAQVVGNFVKDHIYITQLHYEGEVLAADGKGFITLEQQIDLYLTGGLMQKLGGMGSVGNWIKQASDSLLYYHVTGTFQNLKYEVKRGDGKPITEGVKKVTGEGVSGVKTGLHFAGEGLNKAGSFMHGLFNHKKKDDQSQTQPSN